MSPEGGSCEILSSNSLTHGMRSKLSSADLVVARDCTVTGTVKTPVGGISEIHGHLVGASRSQLIAAFKNTVGAVGTMNFGRR